MEPDESSSSSSSSEPGDAEYAWRPGSSAGTIDEMIFLGICCNFAAMGADALRPNWDKFGVCSA
jgi:hypothetical protein